MELSRKPSLLRSVCDRAIQREATPNRFPINDNQKPQSESLRSMTPNSWPSLCSCKVDSIRKYQSWSDGTLSLLGSSAVDQIHEKDCALRLLPRRRMALKINYSYCGHLLSRLLSFSISFEYSSRGPSVTPHLAFRATVPRDSPAFKVFDLDTIIHFDRSQAGSYCTWAIKELHYLFCHQKASPGDVTPQGLTLLHASIFSIVD